MATIWDVLGIEPTKDEREIRRAYARELKRRRPDKDPQGFQALREAFDDAKRYANASSETVFITARDIMPIDERTPVFIKNDVPPPVSVEAPEKGWSRNELRKQAQEFAALLVRDEVTGFGELHCYLEEDIPDSLEAGQAFSLMLAEALSEQKWLCRRLLENVSEMMGWRMESYRSFQFPDWLIHALDVQIANTERENYWLILGRQYRGSKLAELKWRLLTEKNIPIPWWTRLVPDFLQQLRNQIDEIREQFPLLEERLNPVLVDAIDKPRGALSWGAIITGLFWGYTAYVAGYQSLSLVWQSLLMLGVIAVFIIIYPALKRRCAPGGIAYSVQHSAVWLFSTALLLIAVYRAWQEITYWPDTKNNAARAVTMMFFISVPVCWALWMKRREWKTLPISVVVTVIMFPIWIIRQLPMLAKLIGFFVLAILYGIVIPATYFIK